MPSCCKPVSTVWMSLCVFHSEPVTTKVKHRLNWVYSSEDPSTNQHSLIHLRSQICRTASTKNTNYDWGSTTTYRVSQKKLRPEFRGLGWETRDQAQISQKRSRTTLMAQSGSKIQSPNFALLATFFGTPCKRLYGVVTVGWMEWIYAPLDWLVSNKSSFGTTKYFGCDLTFRLYLVMTWLAQTSIDQRRLGFDLSRPVSNR